MTAVYDNECESEPAAAYDDPSVNYVSASVDAVGENNGNVVLYPNPTKGNVTIEAAGMSRITVVSVLGQVVYDTEVNADTYTLNMAQFNAGMYMVRVYTEEGVTVKRVVCRDAKSCVSTTPKKTKARQQILLTGFFHVKVKALLLRGFLHGISLSCSLLGRGLADSGFLD